jgi:4'-phosphopantetheinyl transferase EntD
VPRAGASEEVLMAGDSQNPEWPTDVLWALVKGRRRAGCVLWSHPLGLELRVSVDGHEYLTQVHREREAALGHAEDLRAQLARRGWIDESA